MSSRWRHTPAIVIAMIVLSGCGDKGGGGTAGEDASGVDPAMPPMDANVLTGTALTAIRCAQPQAIGGTVPITGLVAGDVVVGIDRRPVNGMLYALGLNADEGSVRLYHMSSVSGQATPLGFPGKFDDPLGRPFAMLGSQFDIDFNPVTDRLRVVNDAGITFRMNPNTGELIDGIPIFFGTNPDFPINGSTNLLNGAAHTNNSPTASVTTLYGLDAESLYIQDTGNSGQLTSPVPLLQVMGAVRGLDIPVGVVGPAMSAPVSGPAAAIVRPLSSPADVLARIDLESGAVTLEISLGTASFIGPALQDTASVPVVVLLTDGLSLGRFSSSDPSVVVTVPVTGVEAGMVLTGIDWRPNTGQLMGLAVNHVTNIAKLYRLDPETGVGSEVGSSFSFTMGGAVVDLPAAQVGYGIDFDPVGDFLRVVTSTGLNFRVNPTLGQASDGNPFLGGNQPDGEINGLTSGGGLPSAAYTNNYDGALTTTLYVLDAAENALRIVSNPESGTVGAGIAVTNAGAPLDFTQVGGFDMTPVVRVSAAGSSAASGSAYAALMVAGVSRFYRIDLISGAATDLGVIGTGAEVWGLAVGHSTVE